MKLPELIDALTVLRDELATAAPFMLDERDVELTLEGPGDDELEVVLATDNCCADVVSEERGLGPHPDATICEWDREAKTWERLG